jgi:hypothetical protein
MKGEPPQATSKQEHLSWMARKVAENRAKAAADADAARARPSILKARALERREKARSQANAEAAARQAEADKRQAEVDKYLAEVRRVDARRAGENANFWKQHSANLLCWTTGCDEASCMSRYQQATRITARKLSLQEANEASAVIAQLRDQLAYFGQGRCSGKLKKLGIVMAELRQHKLRLEAAAVKSAVSSKETLEGLPRESIVDRSLAASLLAGIANARDNTSGFVYLKQWRLPDGTRWLKIGITNNPARRDSELNVLPVPAVTLKLIELQSMQQAAAVEKSIHTVLDQYRVRNACNRELFSLSDAQLDALILAMDCQ